MCSASGSPAQVGSRQYLRVGIRLPDADKPGLRAKAGQKAKEATQTGRRKVSSNQVRPAAEAKPRPKDQSGQTDARRPQGKGSSPHLRRPEAAQNAWPLQGLPKPGHRGPDPLLRLRQQTPASTALVLQRRFFNLTNLWLKIPLRRTKARGCWTGYWTPLGPLKGQFWQTVVVVLGDGSLSDGETNTITT